MRSLTPHTKLKSVKCPAPPTPSIFTMKATWVNGVAFADLDTVAAIEAILECPIIPEIVAK